MSAHLGQAARGRAVMPGGGWDGDAAQLVDGHEGDHDHGGARHEPPDHVAPPGERHRVLQAERLVVDQAEDDDDLRGSGKDRTRLELIELE